MPDPSGLSWSHGQTRIKTAGGNANFDTDMHTHTHIREDRNTFEFHLITLSLISQVIASAEESLKDFEQRITELKTRGAALQADQISTNKILKLQVTHITDCSH